jgi:hypothetical protein
MCVLRQPAIAEESRFMSTTPLARSERRCGRDSEADGRARKSQRRFYGPFTSVVQKIALTAIADQAYNSK